MSTTSLQIHAVPAFSDNYLWTLVRGADAVVVDPGDGAVVQAFLEARQLQLRAILITHHHPDHIGGLALLRERWDVPVYGPAAEAGKIKLLTATLDDGAALEVLGERYEIMALPGHTLGHIAYYSAQGRRLFCGDTLFSAGCGRLFEGTPQQMHASLSRLGALPGDTAVYCTHEYTQSNLRFALAVEPDNAALQARDAEVARLREAGQPSLPSRIDAELRFNPFLRSAVPAVRAAAEAQAGVALEDEVEVFAALRRWKDGFRG